MPWDLVRRSDQPPAPEGSQQIRKYENDERVADVHVEGARQIAQVQMAALKTAVANEAWARVAHHGIIRGNHLAADAKRDADSFTRDPVLHDMVIELTQDGLREYADGRREIWQAGRQNIAAEVVKPVEPAPREKKSWVARILGL